MQSSLNDWRETVEANSNTTDWPEFDDYGPTMDRPIPEVEVADQPGGVDSRELHGTGWSAADEWGALTAFNGRQRVDEHRESHYPDGEEETIRQDLGTVRDIEENIQEAEADQALAADGGETETDTGREYYGIGAARRRYMDAIDAKDKLEPVENPESFESLKAAVAEISLPKGVMGEPTEIIEKMERIYQNLPEGAQPEYVTDRVILRRLNAARRQFNEWTGRKHREAQMPGPMEAGPSKYPHKKLDKRQKSERNAKEELEEKLDRLRSAAGGANQRALEAIGSSVAEQNKQEARSLMERRREEWEPGDIVVYRSPQLHAGAIVRLNKKSVRVQRREPCPDADWTGDGEFRRETIDLDSNHIATYDADELHKIENLDRGQTVPEDLEAAQRQMLGDEWVEENGGA